ncbi:MAG: cyanophycin synthetase, partial [bacterium]|nr:cyanophycin synthetase [bacterium]
PFAVVLDYAHTPDSLEAVYKTLRGLSPQGKLIAVFGSASGGRDTWKRPVMGKIAAALADKIILTEEDSYDEDPHKIVEEILSGIPEMSRGKVAIELDRSKAIARALAEARPGDTVICTGKGSETSIHGFRGATTPWNEREVIEVALKEKNSPHAHKA